MPIAAALNSCSDSAASPSPETESAPENGAQFKEGKGVTLTPLMAQSIQLKTEEVQEDRSLSIQQGQPAHLRPVRGLRLRLDGSQAAAEQTGHIPGYDQHGQIERRRGRARRFADHQR